MAYKPVAVRGDALLETCLGFQPGNLIGTDDQDGGRICHRSQVHHSRWESILSRSTNAGPPRLWRLDSTAPKDSSDLFHRPPCADNSS